MNINLPPLVALDDAFDTVQSTYRTMVQTSNGEEIKKESLVPQNVTHLEIHESIKNVPMKRFRRFESLRFVSFQSSFDQSSNEDDSRKENIPVSLGREVFWGCRSLTHVKFPQNLELTEIPGHAFAYCFSLQSIELPEDQSSLRVIGECAFLFCEALEELRV